MKTKHLFASCMFLSIVGGAGNALAAGPDVHSSCNGASVGSWLSSSESYASAAASRLSWLAGLSESKRKAAWSSGAEQRWFGAYSNARFNNVKRRMNQIADVLRSSRLDVKCKWNKSYFGNASPGIYAIRLGSAWKSESSSSVDKPQTFVHEAAHVRGAVLGGEVRGKYGVSDALTRARKHPGVAVRTAENLGYYAVCRSSSWAGKGGCP